MFDPVFTILFLAAIILSLAAFFYWLKPKTRQTKRKRRVLIGCAVAAVIGLLYYTGPTLFVSNDGILNAYVIVPPSKVAVFNDDLGAVIEKYGFLPNSGKTESGLGLNYYVMNGTGHSLWLWSTNMPMSGQEDVPTCGRYTESHPDPGQFSLSISRVWPFGTKSEQREYLTEISASLQSVGYEVRAQSILCSPASKALAPR